MKALALVVLAGCFTAYRNAPGVSDLAAPSRVGTGYLEPRTPGVAGTAVWLPLFAGASSDGAAELGGEVRFERFGSDYDNVQLDEQGWAVAAGFSVLRGTGISSERAYAELQHRMTVSDLIPFVVGAGIVFDEHAMPGVQASTHYLMFALRARALVDGTADLTVGFELPLVFLFGHSR